MVLLMQFMPCARSRHLKPSWRWVSAGIRYKGTIVPKSPCANASMPDGLPDASVASRTTRFRLPGSCICVRRSTK